MIRLATVSDLLQIAIMLKLMYEEVFADKASSNLHDYVVEVMKVYTDANKYIFVDDELNGFFMVESAHSILTPTIHRMEATNIYIYPAKRHSKLLYHFYEKLFDTFPTSEIIGVTEANSEHIKVLDKRHKLVSKVYSIKRTHNG